MYLYLSAIITFAFFGGSCKPRSLDQKNISATKSISFNDSIIEGVSLHFCNEFLDHTEADRVSRLQESQHPLSTAELIRIEENRKIHYYKSELLKYLIELYVARIFALSKGDITYFDSGNSVGNVDSLSQDEVKLILGASTCNLEREEGILGWIKDKYNDLKISEFDVDPIEIINSVVDNYNNPIGVFRYVWPTQIQVSASCETNSSICQNVDYNRISDLRSKNSHILKNIPDTMTEVRQWMRGILIEPMRKELGNLCSNPTKINDYIPNIPKQAAEEGYGTIDPIGASFFLHNDAANFNNEELKAGYCLAKEAKQQNTEASHETLNAMLVAAGFSSLLVGNTAKLGASIIGTAATPAGTLAACAVGGAAVTAGVSAIVGAITALHSYTYDQTLESNYRVFEAMGVETTCKNFLLKEKERLLEDAKLILLFEAVGSMIPCAPQGLGILVKQGKVVLRKVASLVPGYNNVEFIVGGMVFLLNYDKLEIYINKFDQIFNAIIIESPPRIRDFIESMRNSIKSKLRELFSEETTIAEVLGISSNSDSHSQQCRAP